MSYPTLEQYQDALQNPSGVLIDPELKSGHVAATGLGMPLALCGGFALTYTVQAGSRKYAVRCFHKDSKALEKRYAAISKKIKELRSPYFLDFEFQPQGIRINQQPFPIVKMSWATGETLGEFLENQYQNKAPLQRLNASMLALAGQLNTMGIAHGDIQTGNLMVANGGSGLQLIDYDGMFVDEIKSLGSSELGHRNFQHPARFHENPFDARLDRFAFIALNLSIRALEADPTLWRKTKSDIDGIIFRANDYADPESSAIFSALFSKPGFSEDTKNFAAICKAPYAEVPTLADFLSKRNIPQKAIVISAKPTTPTVRAYISNYDVLDASNYTLCLRQVGNMVELIGQIVDVKEDFVKRGKNRGKPYVFLNFGNWRNNIVKINIWSEGMNSLHDKPNQSWKGKWVSVVGLMEAPFSKAGKGYSYTHLSVSITQNNQMTVISADEAKFRLAGSSGKPAGSAKSSNAEILERIGAKTSHATRNPASIPPAPRQITQSANQAILNKMRQASSGTQQPPRGHVPPHMTRAPQSNPTRYNPPAPPAVSNSSKRGTRTALRIALSIAIGLLLFSHYKPEALIALIVIVFLMRSSE